MAILMFASGNLQSIVIRRVRLRMIRRGQGRHFEAIDGVEVEESLDEVIISSCAFQFIIDFLNSDVFAGALTLTFVATSLGFIFPFHSCDSF